MAEKDAGGEIARAAPAGDLGAVPGRLLIAVLLLLLAGVSYGLVPSLNRLAALDGVPYLAYVFWQALGAGFLVLLLCALRRTWPRLDGPSLRYYFVMGNIGFGVPYCVLVFIAPHVPAGIIALALALVPILVYGFALALGMERFRLLRVGGIAVGFAGMLFILLPDASLPEPAMAGWAALALVPSVLFALSLIAGERLYPRGAGALPLACGVLFATALSLAPVMLATGSTWVFAAPLDGTDGVVLLSIAMIAITWSCLVEIIRLAGAVFYSTVAYLESLAGIGFGMLIFGERHSLWVWAAVALIFGGLFLVNRGAAQGQARPVRDVDV